MALIPLLSNCLSYAIYKTTYNNTFSAWVTCVRKKHKFEVSQNISPQKWNAPKVQPNFLAHFWGIFYMRFSLSQRVYVLRRFECTALHKREVRLLNAQIYRFYCSAKQHIVAPIVRAQGCHILCCCERQRHCFGNDDASIYPVGECNILQYYI